MSEPRNTAPGFHTLLPIIAPSTAPFRHNKSGPRPGRPSSRPRRIFRHDPACIPVGHALAGCPRPKCCLSPILFGTTASGEIAAWANGKFAREPRMSRLLPSSTLIMIRVEDGNSRDIRGSRANFPLAQAAISPLAVVPKRIGDKQHFGRGQPASACPTGIHAGSCRNMRRGRLEGRPGRGPDLL